MNTVTFYYNDEGKTLGYGVSSSGLSLIMDLNGQQTVVATFKNPREGEAYKAFLRERHNQVRRVQAEIERHNDKVDRWWQGWGFGG